MVVYILSYLLLGYCFFNALSYPQNKEQLLGQIVASILWPVFLITVIFARILES